MKFTDFRLLTDENIDSEIVTFLRQSGFDVLDVRESGLRGSTDSFLLQRAVAESRVILTHDSDFGTLAILQHEPVIGIVFLRPGHFDPQFTIESIKAVLESNPDLTPPFVMVAKRKGLDVTIRIRALDS